MIKRIDEWMMYKVIEQIIEWNSQISNFSGLTVSFVISNAQLEYPQFSYELLAHLKKSGLDTNSVSFEIVCRH